jgi:hypothetical protein
MLIPCYIRTGMQEITTIADAIRPYAAHTKRWVVLLLHSALSVEEQVSSTFGSLE